MVWPTRTWELTTLTEAQYSSWERDGFLVVPRIVPPDLAAGAARAIREFIGANDSEPSTWYLNTLDIYKDTHPDGTKPHHGPSGMVQMFHHSSLWAIRQLPLLHGVFSDIYGTRALYVTCDRAHFKPPQNDTFPAWSNPGDVHKGLHWDIDIRPTAWPLPFAVQGVVYLEDTSTEQGALHLVPRFHRRLESFGSRDATNWTTGPSNRIVRNEVPDDVEADAIPVGGMAGSLVIWHSALPHGPTPNRGYQPRVSAYVTMLPVDASPFVGAHRPSHTPLGMSDAGTLAYFDDTVELRRQSRERRIERWEMRLPLLDQDPREDQLPHRPPGENNSKPAELTPLGRKLVGLDSWDWDESQPLDGANTVGNHTINTTTVNTGDGTPFTGEAHVWTGPDEL